MPFGRFVVAPLPNPGPHPPPPGARAVRTVATAWELQQEVCIFLGVASYDARGTGGGGGGGGSHARMATFAHDYSQNHSKGSHGWIGIAGIGRGCTPAATFADGHTHDDIPMMILMRTVLVRTIHIFTETPFP